MNQGKQNTRYQKKQNLFALVLLSPSCRAAHDGQNGEEGDQAREEEPNLSDAVTKVLSFPTTAVIYPWEVAIASMEVAVKNGVNVSNFSLFSQYLSAFY